MDLLQDVTPSTMALHQAPPVKYLHLSDRTIAFRHSEGRSPTLIYVPGFLSTMEIHKATVIEQYAKVQGRASIRYDQSAVGLSSGVPREKAGNEVWIEDVLAMMDLVAKKKPVVLVASSNGGQICAYIAKVRPEQVKGMVFIGPSVESGYLKWKKAYDDGIIPKEILDKYERNETLSFDTPYGKGYFCKSSHERSHKFAIDINEPIEIHCPVKILHAWKDEEVDWSKSLTFMENLAGNDVDLVIRKQGNHRLMKPRDLTLLIYTIEKLLTDLESKL